MDVSVIIVNYNTKSLTRECIDSVFEKTNNVSFEIILVDNASTDGSREYFEKDKRVIYVYSESNLGFGKANNLGLKYCKGKYVFLLNSDTLLLNDAIGEFYMFMESAPNNVGCIGCELVNADNKPITSFGPFPSVKYYLGRILRSYHIDFKCLSIQTHSLKSYPSTVDYVCGADIFIRREVIEAFGLFDPDFFLYSEETEMLHRYREGGYISQIINSPRIVHLHGASNVLHKGGKRSLKVAFFELQSRYLYCNKTMTRMQRVLISYLHILMIPKILLYNSLWSEKAHMINEIARNLYICFQKKV